MQITCTDNTGPGPGPPAVTVSLWERGHTAVMKFNLFRHIKDQQEETDLFIANCDYKKHFTKKFRKSKTKSSLDYSEPSHRKSGKLLQGRKELANRHR